MTRNESEIEIDNISVLRNTRTELGDLSELMTSIKENGLLEPIGVWKENNGYIVAYGHRRLASLKKLGRKSLVVGREVIIHQKPLNEVDFLVLNLSENLHRKDNSPVEIGRVCSQLKEKGLTISEIAARLSLPISRIKTALRILSKIPKEHHTKIGYMKNNHGKKRGIVPASVAYRIAESRSNKKTMDELFKFAQQEEIGLSDIDTITRMVQSGIPVKTAIKNRNKFKVIVVQLVCNAEELSKLQTSHTEYVENLIKGTAKPNPKLLY